jgi:type IV pilus assembly protein PilM
MKFLDLKYDAFGIDINDSSVKIIKLEKTQGKFSMASFGRQDLNSGIVESGVINNEKELSKSIRVACNNVKGKKLKTKYAVISLPEEESFLQVIQMPKMSRGELKSAVLFEAENYIPLPIDQVYLDFQIITPLKDGLDHLDVLVAATPKKVVDSYVLCAQSAGLTPICAEVESLAIARALVKNETSENPIVLIDIGKNNIGFMVFSGCSMRFTYSIPISPEKFTKQAVLKELSEQIKKYINFYQEHASHEHIPSNGEIKSILLTGGGSNYKNLTNFITKETGIQTEIGNVLVNLPTLKNVNPEINLPSFACAIGLALGGINIEKDNL